MTQDINARIEKLEQALKGMIEGLSEIKHDFAVAAENNSTATQAGQKYEILENDTIEWNGITLFRIKALRNIEFHGVKTGDLGGYVENRNNLSQKQDAWIKDTSKAYGKKTRITGNSLIENNSLVDNNSRVNNSVVANNSLVNNSRVENRNINNQKIHNDNAGASPKLVTPSL